MKDLILMKMRLVATRGTVARVSDMSPFKPLVTLEAEIMFTYF